ncbi:hypothetical protein ILUMI_03359 [Ignelater luminosus]|uniref:C2H2-type domain-containing protein n=1 Tax=Ignelater luminosus TaxID=2038154 RepID=A0A8K0DGH3_IGNLU|nr:hypothetical protein ILUMI_03359 [Ignelater luminosus]
MSDKIYQENVMDNFIRPPCAQQPLNGIPMQPYTSYTMPVMGNNGYNMQSHNMCDYMYGSTQAVNRNNPSTYTPSTSFMNCSEQLDNTGSWLMPDPRAVADIERGLKYTDKMETIEITSKDLSPASCCSNIDLLIPDFYKNVNKDGLNFYNKSTISDSQWYCSMNCNNQKYAEYPSCSQINSNNNFMAVEEKTGGKYYDNSLMKNYNNYNNMYCMQQYEKNVSDKVDSILTENLYCHYENKIQETHHIFNMNDINHEQFYSENDSLNFPSINNVNQPNGDGSNDESDIIVEESDDEDDYSEDLERRYDYTTNCIICNIIYTPVGNQFYILTAETPLTMSSQQPVFKKLSEMIRIFSDKRNYLCSQCLSLINTIDHLQLKLETSRFELYNKYEKTCKENNLNFTAPKLETHKNRNLPHHCKHLDCDKKFATVTKLKNHIKLKHDKKFVAICSICNIGFIKISDYKSHKISHSTEKKFNCTKCEKSYKTLSNLNYHMKFHNDQLPFICDICNKGFMRKEYLESHKNLDAHLKYHEGGIKKKVCNTCNKSITTGFEEHLRTHSNLKEFECELCQMKFNTKVLITHS